MFLNLYKYKIKTLVSNTNEIYLKHTTPNTATSLQKTSVVELR